jgi:hypothetical protein
MGNAMPVEDHQIRPGGKPAPGIPQHRSLPEREHARDVRELHRPPGALHLDLGEIRAPEHHDGTKGPGPIAGVGSVGPGDELRRETGEAVFRDDPGGELPLDAAGFIE